MGAISRYNYHPSRQVTPSLPLIRIMTLVVGWVEALSKPNSYLFLLHRCYFTRVNKFPHFKSRDSRQRQADHLGGKDLQNRQVGKISGNAGVVQDILLELVDRLFLLRDDRAHQVTDRNHTDQLIYIHDWQVTNILGGHQG